MFQINAAFQAYLCHWLSHRLAPDDENVRLRRRPSIKNGNFLLSTQVEGVFVLVFRPYPSQKPHLDLHLQIIWIFKLKLND
jgi:hypothetical protein